MENQLFQPFTMGQISLDNKIVMAPMTRSRAISNIPNELMAEYYRQRSTAGLIITEGTAPSPNGLGYARIPGIYNQEQIEGWKKITTSVHKQGSKIFLQIMHTGRVSHPLNMEKNASILAPSAIPMKGQMYTDEAGMQDYPSPKAMTTEEILQAEQEFVQASINAIEAGFDGVELHGANGYLIQQFLNPATNQRTDDYGGSIENRARFVLEVADKVASAIGKDRTGIRLSPYGTASEMSLYDDIPSTYAYIAEKLGELGLAYIHTVNQGTVEPSVMSEILATIKAKFKHTVIHNGGFDKTTAIDSISSGKTDLVAFGRPFISNPDFVQRLANNETLNPMDPETLYTPGAKGYTDYPSLNGLK
ncbi:alkene reductase [Membranihabitans marinus]|uniref:alkene reductase n=1 Tax=Membranihabitans marinus TaxID=1227546 RepID=UPI001F37521C|nr:alkene reductase [Membranihabitans marinus]